LINGVLQSITSAALPDKLTKLRSHYSYPYELNGQQL
jgi:hypothetical protein